MCGSAKRTRSSCDWSAIPAGFLRVVFEKLKVVAVQIGVETARDASVAVTGVDARQRRLARRGVEFGEQLFVGERGHDQTLERARQHTRRACDRVILRARDDERAQEGTHGALAV
jgi:hypothetical protein